jgi:ssDNA-binding Zn-finger/Zn-ribbon topoisomerase 1
MSQSMLAVGTPAVAVVQAQPVRDVFCEYHVNILGSSIPGATTVNGIKVLALHDVMTLVYRKSCGNPQGGAYSRSRLDIMKKGRLKFHFQNKVYNMRVPGRAKTSPGMTLDDLRILMEIEERHINYHFKQQVLRVFDLFKSGDTSIQVEMIVQPVEPEQTLSAGTSVLTSGPAAPVDWMEPLPPSSLPPSSSVLTFDPRHHFPGSSVYNNDLKIVDGRRAPDYKCSSLCKNGHFLHCGGCPTCNYYWYLNELRNYNVARDKQGNAIVTKQYDADRLMEHYRQVKENNPTWKLDEKGRPIPDMYKKSKKCRTEEVSVQPPPKAAPPKAAPPKPPADMKKAYECSEKCKEGYFFDKGGCPTCNAFWHGLGFRNKERPTCHCERVVIYDPKTKPVEKAALDAHVEDLERRYPDWKKDGAGCPVWHSAFSIGSIVMARAQVENAWFPGKIVALSVGGYMVAFEGLEGEDPQDTALEHIKLTRYAPLHNSESPPDSSLKGKAVMAACYAEDYDPDDGWLAGFIFDFCPDGYVIEFVDDGRQRQDTKHSDVMLFLESTLPPTA